MSKKDEYFTTMESQIKKWDAEVDKLRARSDQMSVDGRAKYEEELKAMRTNRDAAHKKPLLFLLAPHSPPVAQTSPRSPSGRW
jgi:uncharacterized protein HemX